MSDEPVEDSEPDPVDWDLEERDRWMAEHDTDDVEDEAVTIVESDE